MLTWLKDKFKSRSSVPWAEFETAGFEADGNIQFKMRWNEAFINMLRSKGFEGMQQEMVENFLMACQMMPANLPTDTVNPESMPNLTNEANSFRR